MRVCAQNRDRNTVHVDINSHTFSLTATCYGELFLSLGTVEFLALLPVDCLWTRLLVICHDGFLEVCPGSVRCLIGEAVDTRKHHVVYEGGEVTDVTWSDAPDSRCGCVWTGGRLESIMSHRQTRYKLVFSQIPNIFNWCLMSQPSDNFNMSWYYNNGSISQLSHLGDYFSWTDD